MTPKKWSWPLHTGRSLYEAQMQAQCMQTAPQGKSKTVKPQNRKTVKQ